MSTFTLWVYIFIQFSSLLRLEIEQLVNVISDILARCNSKENYTSYLNKFFKKSKMTLGFSFLNSRPLVGAFKVPLRFR
jgi:hypothetical protein